MEPGISNTVDGVALAKYLEDEEYDVPSVIYEFESQRPEAVEVRVEEKIPAELDPNDVGFHPNYGAEHWQIRDDTLVFEYELKPNEDYVTLIAVDPDLDYDVENLVTPPDSVENTVLDDQGTESQPSGGFTRSANGDGETSSGESASGPEIDIDGGRDESEPDRVTDHPPASPTEPSESPETVSSGIDSLAEENSIGEILATELEEGTISEEAVRTLKNQLQLEHTAPRSVSARIDKLQSDVSELSAYTSALEEFLDEQGSAREIIEGFEHELESFENELDSIATRTDEQDRELESLQSDVEQREQEHESLSGKISSVQEDVEDISKEVSRLRSEVPEDDVEERLAVMEDDMAEVSNIIDRLNKAFD